ncbi:adenine nucleotide alpha hydrolases-like protein [Mollisia scopiformis]|uniref:FAD synthase n=1 Tax=Mollisia scopiformis TaxID=149040 RepID=A0A194X7P3_MOLSC|nr:adenine nucleotide alpha hydrolases-like protein [Mollisia scopiformis]KUJ16190.1 adenine nucleotide alpha hydrolases-like protein [Mollisia scopiformis]
MSLRAPEDPGDNTPIITANGYHESIYPTCAALAARVNNFLETEAPTSLLKAVQEQIRTALGVIGSALERYSLDEISLSYNGGKDCLVLLILLLCALAKYKKDALPKALHTVYIISKHPFAEVGAFVDESSATYKLDLVRYAMPMKEAFRTYLEEHKKIKAILVGTRRTDPHGENLTHFDETDSGWPAFMRVHPVIDWHYAEIWAFIRHFEIPYCSLYDQGYTSLGGTTDTHPNPALKAQENKENSHQTFRPAYELVEDDAERLGRDW